MKFRLFPFSRDLRSPDLKERYNTIEQKRADAYLAMHIARKRTQILRGQINTPYVSMLSKQSE